MRTLLHLCGLLLLGLMPSQSWSADAGSEKCLGRDSYVIDLYRNRTEKFDGFTVRARWSIDNDGNGFVILYSSPEIFHGQFIARNGTFITTNDNLCKGEEISMHCKLVHRTLSKQEHWRCKIDAIIEF